MLNRNFVFALAAALTAAACAPQSASTTTSRTLVQVALPASYAPSAAGTTAVSEWFKIEISGPDLDPAEVVTGKVGDAISISAPSGQARIFSVEIHRDDQLNYLTWKGRSAPVDLVEGVPATVGVQLQRTGENQAPTLDTINITAGAYYETSTLEVNTGLPADFEGDDVTLTYEWLVNGETVAGATGATLDGAHFSHFDTVQARVTAADYALSQAFDTNTVTVLNSLPVLGAITLNKLTVRTDATIDPPPAATDADGDAVTYRYDWYIDGVLVTDVHDPVLPYTYFAKNDAIYAIVTPYDGYEFGTPRKSNTSYARQRGGRK